MPHGPTISATICEAALATCATTGFFNPVAIGDRQYIDGALGANNPVQEVEQEAADIWTPEAGDLRSIVKCFISIGTGTFREKARKDSMARFLNESLLRISTETESTERKFNVRWAQHLDEGRYYRFNVRHGLEDIGLEEYKRRGAIEAASREYLMHDARFQMQKCVLNLLQRQSSHTEDFA